MVVLVDGVVFAFIGIFKLIFALLCAAIKIAYQIIVLAAIGLGKLIKWVRQYMKNDLNGFASPFEGYGRRRSFMRMYNSFNA